jgi:sulfur-oxidizing protein SoxA
MQADDDTNPAWLWVDRGAALWREGSDASPSCAVCHGDASVSMRGVAARYPAFDRESGKVLDLEARINDCRARRQHAPPWRFESDELLSLTAFVALQSRGLPVAVDVAGPARAAFERGRHFYYERHGQMNLACNQCHEQNWGRHLLNEVVSQGQATGFPAYRLEWQKLGSEQRRLRACLYGIRSEMPAYGSEELVDLELFLAWRAQGLAIDAPGVRR